MRNNAMLNYIPREVLNSEFDLKLAKTHPQSTEKKQKYSKMKIELINMEI